jgi:PAS domain S-box-containing protein
MKAKKTNKGDFTKDSSAGVAVLEDSESERKRAEQDIRDARQFAESIVATVREPLLVLDSDLRVITANRSFYQTFQVTPEKTENRLLYDIGDRQWDIPKLRELLEKILPKNTVFNDFEVEHDFPTIGRRMMLLNARRIYREGNKTQTILLAIEDITDRMKAEGNFRLETAKLNAVNYLLQETLMCDTAADVSRLCLQAAEKLTGSKFGIICKVNQAGRFDTIAISDTGWDACRVPKTDALLLLNDLEIRGIRGRVIRDERSMIFNDPASHPEWIEPPPGHPSITSFLGVPLKSKGKTFGLIGLGNKESGYDLADREIVEALSLAFAEALHRKEAEEALYASEVRYRRLFETAKDGILILDAETGMIADVNPFLIEMLGFSHEQLTGKAIWEIGLFKDVASSQANFMELQRQGYVRYENLPLECADGRRIEVEFVSNVYTVDHQKVIQCNIRDITDRKRAEEALQELEERFRQVAENAQEWIWEVDSNGLYTYASPVVEKILGYKPEEMVGTKHFYDLFHPEDREALKKSAFEVFAQKQSFRELMNRNVHKNDKTVWLSTSGVPILDKKGNLLGYRGADIDITERKRAEEAIRQASNYNRSLIEASLDPLVTIGSDGKITDINKATEEATGTSREKLVGNDFSDYFTEPEKARAGYLKVLREGLVIDYPLTIKHASGKTIDVLYNAAVYRNEAGQVQGVFAAARDITERKRAEEALSASEVRYRRLFETAKDGIAILDAETGMIVDVNPFLIEMLGFSHEQLTGKAIWEIGLFKDIASSQDKFMELQRQGYVRYENLPLECADGQRIEVEFVSNVYTVDHQKVIQCNIRDITDRKRAEDKLKKALLDLERSNKELEQFAYVASHDLQEPLRMVASFTQLLEKRYKDQLGQDAKDFIRFAADGANRMRSLINDLLAYSGVGARGKPLEPTDCHTVLGQAIVNLSMVIENNHAVVTSDQLPTVMADASQMVQLFQNLVGNAIKFRGEETPHIHVSVEEKGNEWVFSVKDNGIGIEAQFKERIFVAFQRLHSREKYPGTGIGLAICNKIVDRHGGRIWVESELGKGSNFYFTMPKRGSVR